MIGRILLYALILAVSGFGVKAVIALGREGNIRLPLALASIGLAAMCMFLSVVGAQKGVLYVKPEGDPGACVKLFFDALKGGDYYSVYSCLDNYASLGLENTPDTQTGKLIYSALRDSYSYSIDSPCKQEKLNAHQPVSFTYLRIRDMEEDIKAENETVLKEMISTRKRSEVYDADGKLLPAATEESFKTAVSNVLAHVQDYYTTETLDVKLIFKDREWKISADSALLSAITGGTAG